MHVAGVQPVGARGLSGLQAVVTDVRPPPRAESPVPAARVPLPVANVMTAEAVAFPTDGLPMEQRPTDGRPTELRRQKAAARYREQQAPESRGRRGRD